MVGGLEAREEKTAVGQIAADGEEQANCKGNAKSLGGHFHTAIGVEGSTEYAGIECHVVGISHTFSNSVE
ncbi:hypothetical protein FOL47_007758 [Perkinsus chesapeaki]|uniref:Uncharacterized protein n=1 Tax=Perkinsus chesapeaki TaxID=330153 RepID=A0A7J6LI99_PERCH|nr:hypothetical protein FOL47_007758 [Perkinsus chesapeaki]